MTRHDVPKGLEVQYVKELPLGYCFRWSLCKHVVLRDDINRPVKTNTCGHQTMWTVFVDRGTCPICEEAERLAAATGRFVKEAENAFNTPFTITYNMRCRHVTFKARGVRGEDPLYIISSNLTSTKDNPPNSLSGGFCELCYLKVTIARGMKAWSWDQALLSRPGLSRLK
ncbi:hypothetical protein D6D25_07879 [Aureobasidium pullulans]|nr:hypothetical protein D6D25_07879 [Aureobasidium pullulans]